MGTPVSAPRPIEVKSLYRKLQPRWSGLDHEGVVNDQRRRLIGAMIAIAGSEGGYANANIKLLSALAGVSRQTFYDRFATTEGCFLASYDTIARHVVERVGAAYRSEEAWQAQLRAAFGAYAAEVVGHPNAARLALVEAPGAGARALRRTEASRALFAGMIAQSFAAAPDQIALPPAIVRGIVCGIEHVTRRRLAGNLEELPALVDELLAWALSYRCAAVGRLPSPAAERPIEAVPRRSWAAESGDERVRVLRATARLTAGVGYARLTPGQIIAAAGVSEEAFNARYESVEQCFLAALSLLAVEALICAERASERGGDPAAGVQRGVVALMEHVAGDSVFMRVAFGEVLAVGPAAVACRECLLQKFNQLLTRRLPRAQRPLSVAVEASVGAIWGLVHDRVLAGSAELLPALAGQATYLALAPAVGGAAAVRTILAGERERASRSV